MKSIQINDKTHAKIKNFCDKKGLKIQQWAEKALLEKIEKEEKQE